MEDTKAQKIQSKFKEFFVPCRDNTKCLGTILFIHGYCVDHTYFVAVNELSKYFNIYMLDLPGHGINTEYKAKDLTLPKIAQHIVDYIKYKNFNQLILMGHSMGGGLASYVANMVPSRIKKLILVSPYNMAVFYIIKFLGLKALTIFSPKTMPEKYELLDILYKDYKKYLDNPDWVLMNEHQLQWQLNNFHNMKKLGSHLNKLSTALKTRKMQKNINVDTLLLVGVRDRAISGQHTIKGFKRYFKNKKFQYYMFNDSGHLCFEEEQPLFVKKVVEFVKQ